MQVSVSVCLSDKVRTGKQMTRTDSNRPVCRYKACYTTLRMFRFWS